jgi:hypothetical protein
MVLCPKGSSSADEEVAFIDELIFTAIQARYMSYPMVTYAYKLSPMHIVPRLVFR